MNSATPIIRQMSWRALLLNVAALLAAITIAYGVGVQDAMFWGAIAYLVYSIGSRQILAKAHRTGIRLVKQQRFAEAIPKFQESFDFFERHPWIDRFRSIVLMSPSAASYREMALNNIAFCYGQLGDGEKCREFYEVCLERFPDSGLATSALRMLDSVTPSASS